MSLLNVAVMVNSENSEFPTCIYDFAVAFIYVQLVNTILSNTMQPDVINNHKPNFIIVIFANLRDVLISFKVIAMQFSL